MRDWRKWAVTATTAGVLTLSSFAANAANDGKDPKPGAVGTTSDGGSNGSVDVALPLGGAVLPETNGNEPKPPCTFDIVFTNFDAGSYVEQVTVNYKQDHDWVVWTYDVDDTRPNVAMVNGSARIAVLEEDLNLRAAKDHGVDLFAQIGGSVVANNTKTFKIDCDTRGNEEVPPPSTGNDIPPTTGNDIPPPTGNDIPPSTGNDIPPSTGNDTIPPANNDDAGDPGDRPSDGGTSGTVSSSGGASVGGESHTAPQEDASGTTGSADWTPTAAAPAASGPEASSMAGGSVAASRAPLVQGSVMRAAPETSPELARTGTDLGGLASLGGALIALGASLMAVFGRKRAAAGGVS